MPGAAVTGHDQHPAPRQFGAQRCGDLHTVRARHLEIEHRDVGPVRPRHGQRLGPGGGLGDDHEIVLEAEQRGQRTPDEVLVVGEQQPYTAHEVTPLTTLPASNTAPAPAPEPAGSGTVATTRNRSSPTPTTPASSR